MKNALNKVYRQKKHIKILALIIIGILFTYGYTVNFSVAGDGLMHMHDHTALQQPGDWARIFFASGYEQGKGEYITNNFLRPVFNDIIVSFLKCISNYNIKIIRIITLVLHCINATISYIICINLTEDNKVLSSLGACILGFGLTYYSGIYEFGLSFSIWLTFFSLSAFLFLILFLKKRTKKCVLLSLIFTFLAVFTKESAITLGIALTAFLVFWRFKNRKTTNLKAIYIYAGCQIALVLVYVLCRISKLGAATNIYGGIEGDIKLIDSILKFIGYFLLMFNISTPVIEGFMLGNLVYTTGYIFALTMIIVFVLISSYFVFILVKKRNTIGMFAAALIMFALCILPTIKVTRNAPYYSDIAVIAILVLISSLDKININKKILKIFVITFASFFVLCNWITLDHNWRNYSTHLVIEEKQTTIIRDEIMKNVPKYSNVFQASSFERNSDDVFHYNMAVYGGFYLYNIDRNANVQRATYENLSIGVEDAMVLDYICNKNNRDDVEVRYASADNDETCLLKVEVDQLDTYVNNTLTLEYTYDEKEWIQTVDLANAKANGITELWFVIPKNVEYSVNCDYVQSEQLYNWDDLQSSAMNT